MATNYAAIGLYPTQDALGKGIESLKAAGFRPSDVSVLFQDTRGTKEIAVEGHTKAPEGATAGAATGAVVGGVLGWLVGIGMLAIPGIGPLLAAGPIVAALAGAGAAGTAGGLLGALAGMGIPEYEAKQYEGRLRSGGILLSVHCDDKEWAGKAKEILRITGAESISTTGEKRADYNP